MSIHYRRTKRTPEEERAICHQIFHEHVDPHEVMRKHGLSRASLYRIIGGPVGGKHPIEKAYG